MYNINMITKGAWLAAFSAALKEKTRVVNGLQAPLGAVCFYHANTPLTELLARLRRAFCFTCLASEKCRRKNSCPKNFSLALTRSELQILCRFLASTPIPRSAGRGSVRLNKKLAAAIKLVDRVMANEI